MMSFTEMLKAARAGPELTQQQFAKGLGISAQYLCDLEQGRRQPSVRVVNAICKYMGRGPQGRLEWHQSAARACGWEV